MWDYGDTTGAILGGAKAKSVRGSKNSLHIIIEATLPMSYELIQLRRHRYEITDVDWVATAAMGD